MGIVNCKLIYKIITTDFLKCTSKANIHLCQIKTIKNFKL